ncbi:hypothetical protein [Mycoplasmopsis bovis]|nr:hypothetical protein [Mycoplasmopsis bovis]
MEQGKAAVAERNKLNVYSIVPTVREELMKMMDQDGTIFEQITT